MFLLLENRKEIAVAQRKLEKAIRADFRSKVEKDIGYPGGRVVAAEVRTDGRYWFRSADHNGKDVKIPRRLNWFGRYSQSRGSSILVEINVPYVGRSDRSAGFFARDTNTGVVYLFHSGRVGGGRKGVGKKDFCAWNGISPIEVFDSLGGSRSGLLVMPVEGVSATRSAVRYVEVVDQFKVAVRAGKIETPEFKRKRKEFDDFYPEGRGRRTGRRGSKIDYLSRHGEIVDAVRDWREMKPMPKGGRCVKNVLIDMGIAVGGDLVEVFEVKTCADRSFVYSALGQLMVHGRTRGCRRILVLPNDEDLSGDLEEALCRLDIKLLRFNLSEGSAEILE